MSDFDLARGERNAETGGKEVEGGVVELTNAVLKC